MTPINLSNIDYKNYIKKDNEIIIVPNIKYIYYSFIIILIVLFLIYIKLIQIEKVQLQDTKINNKKVNLDNKNTTKCYLSPDKKANKILHLIITRFLIEFFVENGFPKKMYTDEYILNGIRVMKKYLFPSLENQSCKNFTWILMIGDKANKTLINSLLKFNNNFDMKIIYLKDIKNYIRYISKDIDILITTRIDYDDRIYYDAVNDVRKAVNINHPMIIYGYNRGMYYFEEDDKYFELYDTFKNKGVMSVFISLITVLNMVNDIYTIYDLGVHLHIRNNILKRYKSFGIKELNYSPTIFDSGEPKFIQVRQNYSGTYNRKILLKKGLKAINFSLSKFYGK